MWSHIPGIWTSRSGKTLAKLMADGQAAVFPKNAPNAAQFRPARYDFNAVTATPKPVRKTILMRGLQRLANLAPTIMASLDAQADTIADELVKQQGRAEDVIKQFGGLATSLGKVADDVSAALGQITNDPTQVSGGSV